MLTSLETPAHYMKSLQDMRDEIILGKILSTGIINRFMKLFEEGIVAEMHKSTSIDLMASFLLTMWPEDPELAKQTRMCLDTAVKRSTENWQDHEGVRQFKGMLSDILRYTNPANNIEMCELRDSIMPKDWMPRNYTEVRNT